MSRLNIIVLIVFIGALIWITLFDPSRIARIQNGAMVVFSPFMKASTRLEDGIASTGTEPLTAIQLREKVDLLEQERDRLKLEVIQLDEILDENNQLRRALQYTEKAPLDVVAARVINRKPSNWYSTVVIDKGSSHGISVDSPVIVPFGEEAALVGKISEVIGSNSSVVLLLTDEMCQVSAKLQNSQEQGILSGQRGAMSSTPNLRLRFLPKEAEASAGRKVVSSGAGGVFPPELLLGEVASLKVGAIDSEASVEPSINFDKLTDIFVVKAPGTAAPSAPVESLAEPETETAPENP